MKIFYLGLITTIFFFGCSRFDEGKISFRSIENRMEGTWMLNDIQNDVVVVAKLNYYEFDKGGNCRYISGDNDGQQLSTGSWTIDFESDNLIMNWNNFESIESVPPLSIVKVLQLSNSEMEWSTTAYGLVTLKKLSE